MDNNKQNIIKNIAQELYCGFDCYYHPRTNEIMAIPNVTQFSDEEHFKEAFRNSLEKIKKHQKDFIKFEVLKLKDILTNKKPFQNFKNKIDQSEFRQNWFDFKQSELEKIVKNQLESGKSSAQYRI